MRPDAFSNHGCGSMAGAMVSPGSATRLSRRRWLTAVVATGAAAATIATSGSALAADTTPPLLIVHGPSGLINNPEPEFEVEVNEEVEFACSLNGKTLDHCSPTVRVGTLADGEYRLAVSATDPAGNTTTVVREFRIDATVDTLITRQLGGPSNPHLAGFKFEAAGGEPADFFCSLDGGAPEDCRSPKHFLKLAPGAHTFAVYAVDRAGNVDDTPAVREFEIAARG